ncbi:hypothetical protein [Oceanobacillus oncorhynchi]|uniref:hypothetical protein n=1 Tax=Oceanobacillus oncorhynchi TaxID=545501 RepID=UPI0034D6ACE6
MEKTYKLWARVGMTINVPESDKEKFLEDPEKYIESNFSNKEIIEMDGETYFPSGGEENDVIGVSEPL